MRQNEASSFLSIMKNPNERELVKQALIKYWGTRAAAAALGYSQRTLIRKMKTLDLPSRGVGRPRASARQRARNQIFKFTTPEQAAADEINHWKNKTGEERFLAVEMIREATHRLYHDGRKLPRLERICRIVDISSR
jgi:hypothetical protein